MDNPWELLREGGAWALCGVMVYIFWRIVQSLLKIIRNDLDHIKKILADLPCRKGESWKPSADICKKDDE